MSICKVQMNITLTLVIKRRDQKCLFKMSLYKSSLQEMVRMLFGLKDSIAKSNQVVLRTGKNGRYIRWAKEYSSTSLTTAINR